MTDCIWSDISIPDAAGRRWIVCQRPNCGNRLWTDLPHDAAHATCQSDKIEPEFKGVGSELTAILSWFIETDERCDCKSLAAEMDRNGIEWCEQNFEKIIAKLRENAGKLKVTFVEPAVRVALYTAIWNARRNRKAMELQN